MVMQRLGGFDILAKGFTRTNQMHNQATSFEFTVGLLQQVEPIDNKIKLGNHPAFGKVIG